MLHIVGMNISRSPRKNWRAGLGGAIEQFTAKFWGVPHEEVTCFFPHDPSVPEQPWPVATFTVDFLEPQRTSGGRRGQFAHELGAKIEAFLNKHRKNKTARVQIMVRIAQPDMEVYLTPEPSKS